LIDIVSPQRRSANMSRIRSRDTKPELTVRHYLHTRGFRYRLHVRQLPGKPDLVFPSRKLCLFVHGCFWHGCPHCIDGTRLVKSNRRFWAAKVQGNRERDSRHFEALQALGWTVLIVWECEVSQPACLSQLAEEIRRIVGVRQKKKPDPHTPCRPPPTSAPFARG
jgi:DNA mismatch endonuclease (patch repair protein)